eukprot:1138889-Prorocentrum_minimum.AAC.4
MCCRAFNYLLVPTARLLLILKRCAGWHNCVSKTANLRTLKILHKHLMRFGSSEEIWQYILFPPHNLDEHAEYSLYEVKSIIFTSPAKPTRLKGDVLPNLAPSSVLSLKPCCTQSFTYLYEVTYMIMKEILHSEETEESQDGAGTGSNDGDFDSYRVVILLWNIFVPAYILYIIWCAPM